MKLHAILSQNTNKDIDIVIQDANDLPINHAKGGLIPTYNDLHKAKVAVHVDLTDGITFKPRAFDR